MTVLAAAVLLTRTAYAYPSVSLDSTWPAAGATLLVGTLSPGSLQTIPDGEDGLYLAWQDSRALDPASCHCRNKDDIYAQRLDATGHRRWGDRDLAICTWGGLWGGPDVLAGLHPDGLGGAVVIWMHSDGPYGTYGQRVGRDGSLGWGPEGTTLYEREVGVKFSPRSARAGRGILIGLDANVETRARIASGTISSGRWAGAPPFEVALPAQFQGMSLLPGPRAGAGLLVLGAWSRTANGTCWALPVSGRGAGSPQRLLDAIDGDSPVPPLPDGEGGAWVAVVAKTAAGDGRYAIRIQRADEAGRPRWDSGVVAAVVPGQGTPFGMAASPRGDLAVAWVEAGNPDRIAVRAFGRDGRPRWAAPVRVAGRAQSTRPPGLLAIPSGWLVAWTEWDAGSTESLRVATIPSDGGTPEPDGGLVLLRRNDAVSLVRLDPAANGAFVFAFDASTKALLAFRVRAQ